MLTFTSLSPSSFRVAGAGKALTVFPEKPEKSDIKTAIVILSTPEEQSKPGVVSWHGEYKEGGVCIKIIGHDGGQQGALVVESEGVRMAFLSQPLKDWTDQQLEMVGDIDVLALPAGDVKLVQKLVDEFDPRILMILPGGTKGELGAVQKVTSPRETVSEFKLKGSLPAEGREVVVLGK